MITATHLADGLDVTGASVGTAVISPTAENLVILVVHSHVSSVTPNVPTVSGAGMTWTQILTQVSSFDSSHRVTSFRCLSSSPGSGSITIDFAGQSQQEVVYTIDQFADVDATGVNGVNAVVQSAYGESNTVNSVSISLAALGNVNNATYSMIKVGPGGGSVFVGSGFTQIFNSASGASDVKSEYGINLTPITWTSNANPLYAMGFEIKAQSVGGGGILAAF